MPLRLAGRMVWGSLLLAEHTQSPALLCHPSPSWSQNSQLEFFQKDALVECEGGRRDSGAAGWLGGLLKSRKERGLSQAQIVE